MTKYISVGKILNFHGIKGEAKVGFTKNQEDFFCSLSEVFVKVDHNYRPLVIESVRLHKNYALVKFEGINSINELMEYKGAFLYVEEETIRENLEEDEFLIDELVSLEVFDENNNLGLLSEFQITEPVIYFLLKQIQKRLFLYRL